MFKLDSNIRISRIHFCKPCSSNSAKSRDCSTYNWIIKVIAILIQTFHRVEIIIKILNIFLS